MGLKQQKLISRASFWRPEVWNEVPAGRAPAGSSRGESVLATPSFWGLLAFLGSWHPLSYPRPLLHSTFSVCLCVQDTPAAFRAHPKPLWSCENRNLIARCGQAWRGSSPATAPGEPQAPQQNRGPYSFGYLTSERGRFLPPVSPQQPSQWEATICRTSRSLQWTSCLEQSLKSALSSTKERFLSFVLWTDL